MEKNNWEDILDALKQKEFLEVSDIEVRRLHDDNSEIVAGQEVAFVATFKLRLAQQSSSLAIGVGKGDALLEMSSAGEPQSEQLELSSLDQQEMLPQWLAANYDFLWTVNGARVPAAERRHARWQGGDRSALDVPWLLVLDTAPLDREYVDVRIDIRPKGATSGSVKPPAAPSVKLPAASPAKSPAKSPTRSQSEESFAERLVIFELQGERQSPLPLAALPAVVEDCLRELQANLREGEQGELVLSLAWHPNRSASKG